MVATNQILVNPIYFIALPLFFAFLLPLLGKIHKSLVRIVPGLLFAYLAWMAVVMLLHVYHTGQPYIVKIAGWAPPIGINLVFDGFTGFIATFIILIAFLVWVYGYLFKKIEFENALKYYLLLMLVYAGATGVVITGDIFNQFVFLEITGLSSYALTAFYRGRDGAEAAFKYLFIGSLASTFVLIGILLIYTQLGTLNMADIARNIDKMNPTVKVMAFVLLFVGYGIEAEMFPLNGWAPDAYSQTPGPIGSVFAAMTSKAGLYALLRLNFTIFDFSSSSTLLFIMGLLTLIFAEGIALRQERIKRMLAYSSIGQIGLIMIAFSFNTYLGIFAGIFFMLNHALVKSLLFFSASLLAYNSPKKYIADIQGFGRYMPLTALMFGIGAFALVGFPPFSGFWSKFYLLSAAADKNFIVLIILILSVSLIELVYYFRVIHKLYFAQPTGEYEPHKPRWNAVVAMLVLALAIIVIGVYPQIVTGFIDKAAHAIMDKSFYIHSVLSIN